MTPLNSNRTERLVILLILKSFLNSVLRNFRSGRSHFLNNCFLPSRTTSSPVKSVSPVHHILSQRHSVVPISGTILTSSSGVDNQVYVIFVWDSSSTSKGPSFHYLTDIELFELMLHEIIRCSVLCYSYTHNLSDKCVHTLPGLFVGHC
jgi:hypothetical protein